MNLKTKTPITLVILFFMACTSSKPIVSSANLNTQVNDESISSSKTYTGELSKKEYEEIRARIEKELPFKIPIENAILINFNQNARNCHSMFDNGKHYLKVLSNKNRISSRMSSNNKASDFFVFTNDAFFYDKIKMKKNYLTDSGFFYNNIFTVHDNCSAFFILKPNRKFMKHYGGDYYTKVRVFLEMN